jgi:NitT/TauT family transport system substrate-binding protein
MKRALALALLALVACGSRDRSLVRVALNWKPEPEFGGLFEAVRSGAFAQHGVPVEITGGPGAPVVQMLDSGQVEFGVVAADEVLLARDRGVDVVAVFATYQINPQGLMVHAKRRAASLAEVFSEPGRIAVEPGLAYVKYLQQHYDLSRVTLVPYSYSIGPFLSDAELAQQVFVTAEPIAARRAGADVRVFLIADSGFDPYAAVYATRGARVREQRASVEAFVASLREGWTAYLRDPRPANDAMAKQNTEMDAETFEKAAEAQRPLIARVAGGGALGSMQTERWAELGQQLQALGLIDHPAKPDECWFDARASASVSSSRVISRSD